MASSLSSVTLRKSASDGALSNLATTSPDLKVQVAVEESFKKSVQPSAALLAPSTPILYITELLQEAEILTQHHCNFAAKQVLDRIPQHLPKEHQVSMAKRRTAELHEEVPKKIQEYKHLLKFLDPRKDEPLIEPSPLEKKLKEAEVLAKHIYFDKAIPIFLEVKDQLKAPRDLTQSLLFTRCLLGLGRLYLQSSQERTDCTKEAQAELETAYQNASDIHWEERSLREKKEVYGQFVSNYAILHTRMTIQRVEGKDYNHIECRLAECERLRDALLKPQSPLRRIDANKLPVTRIPAAGSAK